MQAEHPLGTAFFRQTDWPEPRPLDPELPPVPAFNIDLLTDPLRAFVEDIAEQMQVPFDIPAAMTIVSTAGCIGHRAQVRPKLLDECWKETCNLFGAVIAPPGYLKSPTLRQVMAPLEAIQREWIEAGKVDQRDCQRRNQEIAMQQELWQAAWKAAQRNGQAPPPQPDDTTWAPLQRRLLLSDSTYEKLHEILADNPAGVLVVRDELSGFLADLEKTGRESERSFWLSCWNGAGYFTVDRIGRGTVHVDNVCASLFGNFLPQRLRYCINSVLDGGPKDDGLFQRLQVLAWPDAPREWRYIDRPSDTAAANRFERICRTLTNLSGKYPMQLTFSEPSRELFLPWLTTLEHRLRDGSLSPWMISHLAKYRGLMPKLAAIFELTRLADRGELDTRAAPVSEFEPQRIRRIILERTCPEPTDATLISVPNTEKAIGLCEYFEAHARRMYSCLVSPELASAHELALHIRNGDLKPTFASRDVYRRGWALLDRERVEAALAVLEDVAWVRPIEPPDSKAGGRPSALWQLNPKISQVNHEA